MYRQQRHLVRRITPANLHDAGVMGSSAPASLKFNPATIRIGNIGLGDVGLPLAVEPDLLTNKD